MALVLIALVLILPFAELAVVVAAADTIGIGWTFVALVALSVGGAWLVRREGLHIWRTANRELAAGRMPARELLDGALVLAAGALLLVPGFITDAIGLILLLPPTRMIARPALVALMARRARATAWMPRRRAGRTYDARSTEPPATGPTSRGSEPRGSARVVGLEFDAPALGEPNPRRGNQVP